MPGFYRMSEDVVYSYNVPSYPFWGLSSLKRLVPDPILEVEVARCSIGVVRGVVQVIQNWFTDFRIRMKFEVRKRFPDLLLNV